MTAAINLARQQVVSVSNGRTRRMELQLESERLRLDAQALDNLQEREKAVVIAMIDAVSSAHEMKLSMIADAFRDTRDIIRNHQEALLREKEKINEAMFSSELSPERFVLIQKRQRELDEELSDIDDMMASFSSDFMNLVSTIDPKLPPQERLAIEDKIT